MSIKYKSLYTNLQKSYQDSTEIAMQLFKENRRYQDTVSRLLSENTLLTEANKRMEAAIDKQLAANLKKAEAAAKTPPNPKA